MDTFSLSEQIRKDLNDFYTSKVSLLSKKNESDNRYVRKDKKGYYFNQAETINLIDLYYNSKFDNGPKDKLGQTKIFLNVGKFRTEVSAKQIDIDVKDGKFIPEEYADPWVSVFLDKEFREWAKQSSFGELLNTCVDNFPKYGTIVLKKVGKDIVFVPLQNLRNEQTAESLSVASYVIEEHPDMYLWELKEMKNWNLEGLKLKHNECITVYERYGYVPRSWLNSQNGIESKSEDYKNYVDALVIIAKDKTDDGKSTPHVFYAEEIDERPYREAHWIKQHGRWLGIGVMEDLFENQAAKNIIINLQRRALHWSSKRIWQSASGDVTAKNLVKDVEDGTILEVGPAGLISQVDMATRTGGEFQNFLNEWEKNSDQKAFTYEVATGENLPSGTPFRLGVILSNAVNSFFNLKREKLGLFLTKVVNDFLVPQFMREINNKDRILAMFSGETGYETIRKANEDFIKSEAARISLLSGKAVDETTLQLALEPFNDKETQFNLLNAGYYKDYKMKYTFTFTGEEIDLPAKLETLKSSFELAMQMGDLDRANKIIERITALSGEDISMFGAAQKPQQLPQIAQAPQTNAKQTVPTPA